MARSTLAAETLALVDAMDNEIFLASLYTELMTGNVCPEKLNIHIITDCKSLHDDLTTNKAVSEKRLRLEIASIKEKIQKHMVKEYVWVPTEEQLADVLTKKGASPLRLLSVLEGGKLQ